MIENPKTTRVNGFHPIFGNISLGCRVFDAGVQEPLFELGDVLAQGYSVAAKNGTLILLEPVRGQK